MTETPVPHHDEALELTARDILGEGYMGLGSGIRLRFQ